MNKAQNERQGNDTQGKNKAAENSDDVEAEKIREQKGKSGKKGARGGAVLGEINSDAKKKGGTSSST